MLFQRGLELEHFVFAALCERFVRTPTRHFGEACQHLAGEEAQPDAFAAAGLADAVHAVVPVAAAHQGQAMLAAGKAVDDGSHAVLVQRLVHAGGLGRS